MQSKDTEHITNLLKVWKSTLDRLETTFKNVDKQIQELKENNNYPCLCQVWKDDSKYNFTNGKSTVIYGMFNGDHGNILPLQIVEHDSGISVEKYYNFWQNQIGRTQYEVHLIMIGTIQKQLLD